MNESAVMGLFGSSRRKTRDPFQASVEQHRRRASGATFGEMQTGATSRRNLQFQRHFGSSGYEHPYMQPGLGFYSGENLLADRRRKRGQERALSVDEYLFRNTPRDCPDALMHEVPCSSYQRCETGPCLGIAEQCSGGASPRLDFDLCGNSEARHSPYDRRDEHFLYPAHHHVCDDYLPSTMRRRRPVPATNPEFQPRRFSSGISNPRRDCPTFEWMRSFRSPPTTNAYLAPRFSRNVPLDSPRQWNAFARRTFDPWNGPPHAPGSYERLRPPHLRQENSRAESRRGPGSEW